MVECVTLSARLASYFNIKIRERGEQVHHGHLVTIKDGSEAEVAAQGFEPRYADPGSALDRS